MSKQPKEYLKHILDEIEFLLFSSKDINEDKFMYDETLQRAYSRSLEIIGEASKKLPNDFKLKYQEIEWKKLAGMRDKIIHHYFGVDYDLIWDVVNSKLPSVKTEIFKIINSV